MTKATPTKLKNGSWGARVQGAVASGDTITITTKTGKSWEARVTRVLWSGDGIAICATESLDSGPPRRSSSRGQRTGCSCGSREDSAGDLIPSVSNCQSCNFDAYDC